MNTSQSIAGTRGFGSRFPFSAALLALVLLVAVMPSTAHAQRRFGGGRGFGPEFGRGLGWGLGVGIGSAVVYDSFYYSPPVVYTTASAPTIYYIPQQAPQTVVVNSAPVPTAPVAAPAVPVVQATPASSNAGKMSKIVYDSNGKPLGVLILNADGRQEFVPLAQ